LKPIKKNAHTPFDRPEILAYLFYPRREEYSPQYLNDVQVIDIPVDDDVIVGGRFYLSSPEDPILLFFHGNGEIAADYNDIAPVYRKQGINFVPVDFRGYGRSSGFPTVESMLKDSISIFKYIRSFTKKEGFSGPLIVMGRSLGSASALEIASQYQDEIDGLIIESGFSRVLPLLETLGVDLSAVGFSKDGVFKHKEKIAMYNGPTLIIHAEYDHIIPFCDGQDLFDSSSAPYKKFHMVPGANHNNIMFYGFNEYLGAVKELLDEAAK